MKRTRFSDDDGCMEMNSDVLICAVRALILMQGCKLYNALMLMSMPPATYNSCCTLQILTMNLGIFKNPNNCLDILLF
jgi:hypothetical protein